MLGIRRAVALIGLIELMVVVSCWMPAGADGLAREEVAAASPAEASPAETLAEVGRALARLAKLDPGADIACDIEGAARYLSDVPLERPQEMLFDRALAGQGIFLQDGSALTIKLEFPSAQRIQTIQLLYVGEWAAPGVPEVAVVASRKRAETTQLGAFPAITQQPPRAPYIQQFNFPNDAPSGNSSWRRLALSIPSLPPALGLVEMRVIGHDTGLRRIAATVNQVSGIPEAITAGNVSQIAAAVRSRRLAAEKKSVQAEIVERLSALVSRLTAISVELVMPANTAGSEQSVVAQIVVHNGSERLVEQAIVKLRLPPGWRAAPARIEIETLPAGQSVYLPVTFYPVADSDELPAGYLYGAHDGEPLFLTATCRIASIETAP